MKGYYQYECFEAFAFACWLLSKRAEHIRHIKCSEAYGKIPYQESPYI